MDYQSIVTFVMEMAGSVAFAASGAMVGVERNMDIFGVSVLGVATAVGGGMIRDIVLGIIPPAVFTNPVYALVSVLASCIVFFIFYFKRELLQGHRRETYDKIMLAMDSVGLGIFTVVGVNTGIRQGYMDNVFLLVFLGTITGVGGGLLRDMMASVPPYYFCKTYLCLCLHHWCSCMRIYESICGKCTGYGSIINCSGADPISGSTLPLESAQAVTT